MFIIHYKYASREHKNTLYQIFWDIVKECINIKYQTCLCNNDQRSFSQTKSTARMIVDITHKCTVKLV